MFTLVPPSRLESSLANAVIDMKSSNVFVSTSSPVVTLWSASFQHRGLLSSELWECENARKATRTSASCGLGIRAGKGAGSRWQWGEGAGSCHLNSISLSHYPVLKLHPFIFMVSTSLSTPRPASFTHFISSTLDFHSDLLRIIELFQKKDQLVEIGTSWWRIYPEEEFI